MCHAATLKTSKTVNSLKQVSKTVNVTPLEACPAPAARAKRAHEKKRWILVSSVSISKKTGFLCAAIAEYAGKIRLQQALD